MRTAFASLIIVAGLVGAAQAQTTAPAAPPAQAPAQAPAEAPPTLPTQGDGAQVVALLDKVCVPAVRGQSLDQAAKAAGYRLNKRDGVWVAPLGGDKAYTITVLSQGSNKNVCVAEIHFAVGQDQPLVDAINVWSFLHQPRLVLQANYVNVDADGVKRVRKSWEHVESNGATTAVNITVERNPNDTPLNPRYDTAKVFYQERAGS